MNADRYAGYILLQYQQRGQTWYVDPLTKQKYYNGSPRQALRVMQHFALGITNADLEKIPVNGSTATGDLALRQRLSGRFLLAVQDKGKLWYVYPKTRQRYLIDSSTAAFWVMRNLSTGVTDAVLASIPTASGFGPPTVTPVSGLAYTIPRIVTNRGTFITDILTFDPASSGLKFTMDTANTKNCATNCPSYSLNTYITRRNGIAGMHGAYACPPDYASCAGQINFYYAPIYNSYLNVMINSERIRYTTEPLVAVDTSNRFFFYRQANTFTSYQDFLNGFAADSLAAGGTGILQAAISNHPALVINGENVVSQFKLDTKQATVKSYRGVLAWKGSTVYLVVVHDATVTDAAAVMAALGVDNALNLDGGGSTALYVNGRYQLGPGRNLTNVIVIKKQ